MTCYTVYQLYDALNQESKQLLSDVEAAVVNLGFPPQYNPRHVPSTIGRVSIGEDYRGFVFIDDADVEDPVMVFCYDTWTAHRSI